MLIPYLLFGVWCSILSYITPKQFLVSYLLEYFMLQPGTYLYHAHYGMQREAGLYGLIRVAPRDPEPFNYDFDRSIILNDWYHKSTYEQAAGLSSIPFQWVGEPQVN